MAKEAQHGVNTSSRMDPGVKYALMLMPLSVMLLSILRCGQFLSNHGFTVNSVVERIISVTPSLVSQRHLDTDVYSCDQNYTIEILSIDPLVLYINNFLRDEEIEHLIALGEPRFGISKVFAGSEGFKESLNRTIRSSETAFLPKDDLVCQCMMQRMRSLLGNVQHLEVESPQIVKYASGGDHYNTHTDWFDVPKYDTANPNSDDKTFKPSNRLGSIFAYLSDDCEHGETYFPHLPSVQESADGRKFALAEGDTGLLVRPRRGNAVFWNNLHPNGTGDERTAHASVPIESGTKIGLNIWSRYFLGETMVGGN
ncbi:2OG-Fe(II) oxygenase family oxidoreductase [Xylariaceae sp. FL0255]|nr:2OG-Fe(II) oxygenase family oxidoreductase [Xylariaceae sp. FL0255]